MGIEDAYNYENRKGWACKELNCGQYTCNGNKLCADFSPSTWESLQEYNDRVFWSVTEYKPKVLWEETNVDVKPTTPTVESPTIESDWDWAGITKKLD